MILTSGPKLDNHCPFWGINNKQGFELSLPVFLYIPELTKEKYYSYIHFNFSNTSNLSRYPVYCLSKSIPALLPALNLVHLNSKYFVRLLNAKMFKQNLVKICMANTISVHEKKVLWSRFVHEDT